VPTELQRTVCLPLNAAARFDARTRRRLERALGRTALVPPRTRDALRNAVALAVSELLAHGVDDADVEATMRAVVDEAGIAHGAFTASVVTQAPRWREIEDDVMRWTRADLARARSG